MEEKEMAKPKIGNDITLKLKAKARRSFRILLGKNKIKKRIKVSQHSNFLTKYYMKERDGKKYLARSSDGRYKKFIKKMSNRQSRRKYKDVAFKGAQYRKLYDYWWELY